MSARTIFLGKLLGLFIIVVTLSMLTHRQSSLETVSLLVHDRPLVLILGLIGLAAGLAIVLSHNVWSGGVLPVLVTLVGWMTMFRGALVLFLSPDGLLNLVEIVRLESLFSVYMTVALILGVFLTYAGFKAPREHNYTSRPNH
jgi:hypothetical protein